MSKGYHQIAANASNGKGGVAPYNTPISGVMQHARAPQDRKLLDQFRDKMRSLHYALATEKAYYHWIVEFLRFHRNGDQWKHPATLGKPEIEAFLTHLATRRRVSAKTQNQAFSAILFLYKHVLEVEFPKIDALRAKQSRRLPVVLSQQEVARLIENVEGGGGIYRLMVELTYGAGLRLLECCRLHATRGQPSDQRVASTVYASRWRDRNSGVITGKPARIASRRTKKTHQAARSGGQPSGDPLSRAGSGGWVPPAECARLRCF